MGTYANFYGSKGGDRKYGPEAFEEFIRPFFKTGVFNGSLQVVSDVNMTVTVNPGYVNINGKTKFFENPTRLTLDGSHPTLDRIDTIVVRRDDIARDFTLKILKGTSSVNPEAPAPVRSETTYDLALAQIRIPAASIEVKQVNIIDTRMDGELCGWVATAIEEIPFEQVSSQFEAWFKTVQGIMDGDTAGKLTAEMLRLDREKANKSDLGDQVTFEYDPSKQELNIVPKAV